MSLPHELEIRVRYSETDRMGVVHHSSYLIYLEEGRTALMRDLGLPYDEVEDSGFALGVRKLDVRYRQPARYGDVLKVRTEVLRLRNASILFGYEIRRMSDGALLFTGSVETVCVEGATLKPVPTPPAIQEALEKALAGSPA